WITRVGVTRLDPRRMVRAKSAPSRMRHSRASMDSGRQLGATLATTIAEDRSAGARPHAQAEAVLLGATTVVGLVGALAHEEVLRSVGARSGGHRSPMTVLFHGHAAEVRPLYGTRPPPHGSN